MFTTIYLPYYIFLEYALIFKNHVRKIFIKNPPYKWNNGKKGDIVLIPGLFENWVCLSTIADALNLQGYRILTINQLLNNTAPIIKQVELLDQYISKNRLNNFIFLCHSKGGLIAKIFLDTKKNGNRVKQVISLASPYHGSAFARIPFLKFLRLDEFHPSKEMVKAILLSTINNNRIFNLYPIFDNHTVPRTSAILEGATNIEIPVIGHTRILEDDRTVQTILDYLNQAARPRR